MARPYERNKHIPRSRALSPKEAANIRRHNRMRDKMARASRKANFGQ